MNKIWLIMKREFLTRVQKRSFLIATILIPLIFPLIMGVMIYFSTEQKKHAEKKEIQYVDESGLLIPDTSVFRFKPFPGTFSQARLLLDADSNAVGTLLHIPKIDVMHPTGIKLYGKTNLSPSDIASLEQMLENRIRDVKMEQLKVSQKLLDEIKTDISIDAITVTAGGHEEASDSTILFGMGMACGILMYMFIFIYGAQIMQGVIEEKSSKVVEIIVSSVRPFQLMMGKILGLASVGLLQFLIWIVLITTISTTLLAYFGVSMPQQQMLEEVSKQYPDAATQNYAVNSFMYIWDQIPLTYIILNFLFYFLGGYLLYGALFAAVGAAVDSPAEAQQFMFPITIPLLIAYLSLFAFVLEDHDSAISVWLSIIPFTAPITMIGRLGFGVPWWQLLLSQGLLIIGFIFTTWAAGRIYRIGILMHGAKVNYRVLLKWFLMRN
jgi:ABC-2 type transport system permease protein